jgi:hypothetical protein
MRYDVVPVDARRLMRAFLALPWSIYRNDPVWVPQLRAETRRALDARRNPYYRDAEQQLLLCLRDGVPVARCAVLIKEAHERAFGVRTAFFGFFESIPDGEAVRALFDMASVWCGARGAVLLEGPFNPHHAAELGLQADHFSDAQIFFQTHNPPWYADLLRGAGFEAAERVITYRNPDVRSWLASRGDGNGQPLVSGEYRIRPFRMSRMREDLGHMRDVFNDAFARNWHFLPASEEDYAYALPSLRHITDPALVVFAEHRGTPVGVLMCVPDINPLIHRMDGRPGPLDLLRFRSAIKRLRTVVIYAVGLRRAYQATTAAVLLARAWERIMARYDVAECTWISESNTRARRGIEHFGMREDKHFDIYRRRLAS